MSLGVKADQLCRLQWCRSPNVCARAKLFPPQTGSDHSCELSYRTGPGQELGPRGGKPQRGGLSVCGQNSAAVTGWRRARLCGGVGTSWNLWRSFGTDRQVNQRSGIRRDRCSLICLLKEAAEASIGCFVSRLHSRRINGVAGGVTGMCGIRKGNDQRPALPTRSPGVRSLRPRLCFICFSFSAAASRSIDSSVSTFSFQFILPPPPSILHCSLAAAPLSPVRLERRITETLSRLSRAGGAAGPHKCTLDYLQEREASPPARRR